MVLPMATEVLTRYAELQSALCIKLADQYDIEDDLGVAFCLPKAGKLALGTEDWSFARHGKGARLTRDSDSCVVDAVDMMVSHPTALDAWRLIDHFESINVRQVRNDDEVVDVTTKIGVVSLLEALTTKGFLCVIDRSKDLYVIA